MLGWHIAMTLAFSEHERQYDEHVWKAKNNVRVGLPEDAGLESSKVMNGGRRKVTLPAEILQRLDAKWKELVTPVTGYATYSDMKANEKLL